MTREKPVLGISLGDVAGVGPEVAIRALSNDKVWEVSSPFLIGDRSVVEAYLERILPLATLELISHPAELPDRRGIFLLDRHNIDFTKVHVGQVSKACGEAALDYIRTGVDLCLRGGMDAIVTAPIHKEAVQQAGIGAPGHTEFLARLCGVQEVRMLLVVDHLRVMHLTTHLSLRQAIEAVKRERILDTIQFAVQALGQLKINGGRIALAGLNPHAGEGGMFGREEIEEIIPAVEEAVQRGWTVAGPIPPDTVFYRMDRGDFDMVIAMYHDQGHIPLKLMGFDRGVNITIGLPIIRTSVDHGTAFDIAGKLLASPASMIQALLLAARMARPSIQDDENGRLRL
jgi:4-phospho-D-threonate 3-dehydrogenase / 4-phospho-D-erythronate 3-dehydrogenase